MYRLAVGLVLHFLLILAMNCPLSSHRPHAHFEHDFPLWDRFSTGSTIQQIGEKRIHTSEELTTLLHSNIGGKVNIIWLDNNGNNRTRIVNIPSNVDPKKPILGVSISSLAADPGQALEIYKHQFVSGPIPMLPPPKF